MIFYMGIEPLAQAPRTLYELFKSEATLEEKAFKFLETHYELGTFRRTAIKLKIDPKTAKSIYEFLLNTEIGHRFNALLLEQTETFYSVKTFTNLFEGFNQEIERVESMIREENKIIQHGEKALKDAELVKETTAALLIIANAETRKLRLITEKRHWMSKLLDTSMACRAPGKEIDKERKKDDIKQTAKDYDDLLDDYNPAVPIGSLN